MSAQSESGRSGCPRAGRAGEPSPGEGPRAPLHVLVIDDEPNLRKLCQRVVERMGHVCETAASGMEAAALAAGAAFDVVLCDFRLATETAVDVVRLLRATAPELVGRTVIATGAANDPDVVMLCEAYGLEVIAKPYGYDEIAAMIERALG
ncbi:MAG: response regulator [Dehalococcoidia bacterium]|nr:response regulator [Dehalococcoidia bacterium]